jgi:hypothetical protein
LAVSTIASYGLAIVGVVLMVIAILPAFTTSMTYPTARLQLTNLLRSNPNQAEMVSRAMKGTFGEALAMGMKTAGMAKSRDPAIIMQAIYPGYDAVAGTVSSAYKQILSKMKLAGMALIGGLGVAISAGNFPLVHILAAVFGAVAAGLVLMRKTDAENAVIHARRDLVPEAIRAISEGRYAFPPG